MTIPTIDLSPFFTVDGDDIAGKKKAMETLNHACEVYGMFKIINHGLSPDVMAQALHLSTTFFDLPDEEKFKSSSNLVSEANVPAGYKKQAKHLPQVNEYLAVNPVLTGGFDALPSYPPTFREVLEELYTFFQKLGEFMQKILNDCLGFPQDCLKGFNDAGRSDFMINWYYPPASKEENSGLFGHNDGNSFTFLLEDEVGGLELMKDGEWIPIVPTPGAIMVNLGDTIQVLSNNKFKSAFHRVLRPIGKSRYSFAYFYNTTPEKWLEPLANFTEGIGEAPKYRRFSFKEYQTRRLRINLHPPGPDHVANLSYYAIPA